MHKDKYRKADRKRRQKTCPKRRKKKFPKELNEMEGTKIPDAEFKTVVMMLKHL